MRTTKTDRTARFAHMSMGTDSDVAVHFILFEIRCTLQLLL